MRNLLEWLRSYPSGLLASILTCKGWLLAIWWTWWQCLYHEANVAHKKWSRPCPSLVWLGWHWSLKLPVSLHICVFLHVNMYRGCCVLDISPDTKTGSLSTDILLSHVCYKKHPFWISSSKFINLPSKAILLLKNTCWSSHLTSLQCIFVLVHKWIFFEKIYELSVLLSSALRLQGMTIFSSTDRNKTAENSVVFCLQNLIKSLISGKFLQV